MELTYIMIAKEGFTKVNPSTWRYNSITLQNAYIFKGNTMLEQMGNIIRGYKVCVDGVYLKKISTLPELKQIKIDHESIHT